MNVDRHTDLKRFHMLEGALKVSTLRFICMLLFFKIYCHIAYICVIAWFSGLVPHKTDE